MPTPEMHEALTPVAWLLGTWRGQGKGIYPTIDDFAYEEELTFWHAGKPAMPYTSKTWSPDDGRALHAEMGYWRPQSDGSIEVVIAHSFGLTEIMHGTHSGERVSLESVSFGATPTAKQVTSETRVLELRDGALTYEMSMDFGGQGLQNHLSASLSKLS
ncbi:MAG: hypothetical protein QOG04_714 [Actinomycetota bacterium]|nr:hypothetical protein [Actinomycetota bacterium]